MTDNTQQSDERWHADGERYGWALPPKAAWPLRLPLVRTLRGAWLHYRVERWAGMWASCGIGFGGPAQYDLWVVYAVKRGWC